MDFVAAVQFDCDQYSVTGLGCVRALAVASVGRVVARCRTRADGRAATAILIVGTLAWLVRRNRSPRRPHRRTDAGSCGNQRRQQCGAGVVTRRERDRVRLGSHRRVRGLRRQPRQRQQGDPDHERWEEQRAARLVAGQTVDRVRPQQRPMATRSPYWKIEANGSTNVWTQSLAVGSPRRVTADAESINYPAWSPDGQWLAVGIKRGKVTHVGVVSKNDGPVEQITHETGLSGAHSWSPPPD
jgi:hypothetical protein